MNTSVLGTHSSIIEISPELQDQYAVYLHGDPLSISPEYTQAVQSLNRRLSNIYLTNGESLREPSGLFYPGQEPGEACEDLTGAHIPLAINHLLEKHLGDKELLIYLNPRMSALLSGALLKVKNQVRILVNQNDTLSTDIVLPPNISTKTIPHPSKEGNGFILAENGILLKDNNKNHTHSMLFGFIKFLSPEMTLSLNPTERRMEQFRTYFNKHWKSE